jgi:predicted TIM-barrel fold metal-dependent hydrolase
MPELFDTIGDLIVADMDAAGIDKSVLLVNDWGTARWAGEARKSIEELHQLYAEAAKRHPGRLIPFAGIDPRRPNAAQRLRGFIEQYDMKGIKLHPSSGFYPNSKECYPIYEIAAEKKLPVVLHTGELLKPFYFKYTQPILMQEVVTDYPEVTFIFAHAGGCWLNEAVAICASTTNVYLDFSLWQMKYLHPMSFYRTLRGVLDSVSWQRVLFGSDAPVLRTVASMDKWVKAFSEIPDYVKEAGLEFPKEAMDALLGGNAARILGFAD